MVRQKNEIYRRGKYWLDWDRRSDGALRSPNLIIFWYDAGLRRVRTASTGTPSEADAKTALDGRYLADADEAPVRSAAYGQVEADGRRYLVTDAISTYRSEIGDARESGESIASRLTHIVDYLETEKLADITCAAAAIPAFASRFRIWSAQQPVLFYNGAREVTQTRPRAPATTEASLAQLAAALNHAVDQRRSDARPEWRALRSKQVDRTRTVRTGVDVLATMLAYAAEPSSRRGALHAFLVGSLCTLARPITVRGISTDPRRGQWRPGADMIELELVGRVLNEKSLLRLPVMPLLEEWLVATLRHTNAERPSERTGGWLVSYNGHQVHNVEKSWRTMLLQLGLPLDREWQSYLLRQSLATLMRGAGVDRRELEAWLGKKPSSRTKTYATEGSFTGMRAALGDLQQELEIRAPGALHRNAELPDLARGGA